MKKVISVRIEEEFIDIIEKYVILYRQVMGLNLKKSDIIEGCIHQGFQNYINSLNCIANGELVGLNGEKINIGIEKKEAVNELKMKYDEYMYHNVYKDGIEED